MEVWRLEQLVHTRVGAPSSLSRGRVTDVVYRLSYDCSCVVTSVWFEGWWQVDQRAQRSSNADGL